MTNPISDILKAEVILATGTNTDENHPIIANYVKEAVTRKRREASGDRSQANFPVDHAVMWLRPETGNRCRWINGLMHIIIKEGWHAKNVDERTEGFEELKATPGKHTRPSMLPQPGIAADDLYEAARLFGNARPGSILYAMGITQHTTGTDNVKSLANLATLCGRWCHGGGVNPLRGQNNVQGACDMGCLPNVLPDISRWPMEINIKKFAGVWGELKTAPKPGITLTEMFGGAESGQIKAILCHG